MGELRWGLCLGDGNVFYSPKLVFIALRGLGDEVGLDLFSERFHSMVAFPFSMNEFAFNKKPDSAVGPLVCTPSLGGAVEDEGRGEGPPISPSFKPWPYWELQFLDSPIFPVSPATALIQ